MTRILIDLDIVAYRAATVTEQTFDFGIGGEQVSMDIEAAKEIASQIVETFKTDLSADEAIICMSHQKANWRRELWPEYKANRDPSAKPQSLPMIRKALKGLYKWVGYPRLEGDDIMGILSDKGIMVSEDKDMMTVPGLLYRPHHPMLGVIEISQIEADRFHMWQTVVGDPVDGIPGCRGLGKGSDYAEDIISGADDDNLWATVLEAYASKGQSEEEALLNARMTHILRPGQYDKKTGKVKLFMPY